MKNLLEGTVRALHGELRAQNPQFCACEMCQADVEAYALNIARPRYSGGTAVGQALIALDLQRDQTRAELAVLVLDAMRRVAASPRHAARDSGPGSRESGGTAGEG
ncbi:MAG TPA: late competence development ComFB family protein [Gemmatimonadaceae bacterium]|nr:late competence development ComFB family protein [Gemmatimonadaceae bacterium]